MTEREIKVLFYEEKADKRNGRMNVLGESKVSLMIDKRIRIPELHGLSCETINAIIDLSDDASILTEFVKRGAVEREYGEGVEHELKGFLVSYYETKDWETLIEVHDMFRSMDKEQE